VVYYVLGGGVADPGRVTLSV